MNRYDYDYDEYEEDVSSFTVLLIMSIWMYLMKKNIDLGVI